MTSHQHLVALLLKMGTSAATQKAEAIRSSNSTTLHLRSLGLTSDLVVQIAEGLSQKAQPPITSISFSYNHGLGDQGAIALAAHLPSSLWELGLVDCGIQDEGGKAILKWAHSAPNLRMICIENNSFSTEVKKSFSEFSRTNPNIMVMY